ncbi:MAG: hypothetical protein MJ252_15190, partial [archaeon]|nr:hypothetical protein [archaeon]
MEVPIENGKPKINIASIGYDEIANECGYCGSYNGKRYWKCKLNNIPIDLYERLYNRNFLKCGNTLYRDNMEKCCCKLYQSRVIADKYKASKAQRKVMKNFRLFLKDQFNEHTKEEKKKIYEEKKAEEKTKMQIEPEPKTKIKDDYLDLVKSILISYLNDPDFIRNFTAMGVDINEFKNTEGKKLNVVKNINRNQGDYSSNLLILLVNFICKKNNNFKLTSPEQIENKKKEIFKLIYDHFKKYFENLRINTFLLSSFDINKEPKKTIQPQVSKTQKTPSVQSNNPFKKGMNKVTNSQSKGKTVSTPSSQTKTVPQNQPKKEKKVSSTDMRIFFTVQNKEEYEKFLKSNYPNDHSVKNKKPTQKVNPNPKAPSDKKPTQKVNPNPKAPSDKKPNPKAPSDKKPKNTPSKSTKKDNKKSKGKFNPNAKDVEMKDESKSAEENKNLYKLEYFEEYVTEPKIDNPVLHKYTLEVTDKIEADDEKLALYSKYEKAVHDNKDDLSKGYYDFNLGIPLIVKNRKIPYKKEEKEKSKHPELLKEFYGDYNMIHRIDGKLVMVSVIEITPHYLISEYCYYDPSLNYLNLGTLGAIRELEYLRYINSMIEPEKRIPYYSMSVFSETVPKMIYKSEFKPFQVLDIYDYKYYNYDDRIKNILKEKKLIPFDPKYNPSIPPVVKDYIDDKKLEILLKNLKIRIGEILMNSK